MSLQCKLSREVPPDTAKLGQTLYPPESLHRQIGDRLQELLPGEEEFGFLYAKTGRNAISPLMLSLVLIFQFLERVPDRQAAEMVVSRIDWKYACHLPLTYKGFDFTDLHAFRERLKAHGQERLVFEGLLERLKGLGLVRARGRVRTDSTHVVAVVADLSQLELVQESIRVALLAAVGAGGDWADGALPPSFQEQYQERQSLYGLSQAQVRQGLEKGGKDGFWLLEQLDQAPVGAVRQLREVKVLRQVLGQQYPEGPEAGPVSKRPASKEVIASPHDSEARRGSKRGHHWTGYKAQISETCEEDLPRLIVDLEVTGALDNDAPQLPLIQERLGQREVMPAEHLVDRGYMSGANIARSHDQGIELVAGALQDTGGPEGFRQADFDIDEEGHQATCRAGHSSSFWSESLTEGGLIEVKLRFGAHFCRECGFFGRCTTSPQGRSLTLHPYRHLLQGHREQAASDQYRDRLKLRVGVESTISEATRGHGLRQARYRGRQGAQLQASFTAAAIDLKRVARWWAHQARQAKDQTA